MADIKIRQTHRLSEKEAKEAVQKVADKVLAEYGMTTAWNGNVLDFGRSGVSGKLVLNEKEAQIEVTLGFFFKVFSARIEEKIAHQMRKSFADIA